MQLSFRSWRFRTSWHLPSAFWKLFICCVSVNCHNRLHFWLDQKTVSELTFCRTIHQLHHLSTFDYSNAFTCTGNISAQDVKGRRNHCDIMSLLAYWRTSSSTPKATIKLYSTMLVLTVANVVMIIRFLHNLKSRDELQALLLKCRGMYVNETLMWTIHL